MGATTKLNIGKIPVSKGEYQEGTAYQRLNQVTMLGSTYQSKIDDNTSAPAQMGADGAVENINTDKWLCIAVGNVSAARKVVYNNETSGLEAGNVQEAIDEVGSKVSDLSKTVDKVIIEDKEISLQKDKTVTLKYKEDIPDKYINNDSLYMSILSSDDTIRFDVAVYDTNETPLHFTVTSKKGFILLVPLEKKYKKYSIYAETDSEETKNAVVSVIFGFNTYNSKNVGTISKNVDTIVRSCRYRGKITVEDQTVKFGVGYIYLYTTKEIYPIRITEEKVFENIAQNNMFIVVDTANSYEITTRNEGSGSDNRLNRITDIPLLYWDSGVVYGYLANYFISFISKNVDAVSKNVDAVSKNVDTIAIVRNKTITFKKGETKTIAYKSLIPSSYIDDNILYVTLVTDTKDVMADFTLYEEDETMTSHYNISLDKTNTIAMPLENKYKKYSIYIRTNSEEQIVTSIKVMLGRNSYMISSLDDKTNKVFDVTENNFVSLPSNIKEEIGTTFKRFSSWNAGKDKIVFPVFTDIHAGTTFNKIKQLKNLIDNFNQFGFDFYANLGDIGIDVAYTNGGLDASYKLLNYISDTSNTANAPVLFANGNHETIVKELPTRVRKEYLNKPQERKWKGLKYADGGNNGTYFNEGKGLKVIILDNYAKADTDNNSSYLTYEGIDKEQLSWFIDELVKAKDVENIIVLEHCFPYYKGNWRSEKEESWQTIYEDPAANDEYCPSRASIRNAIIAFNKRQTGTDSVYNDVSYDFSNATGTICGLFSGHSHFDVHHQEDGLLLVCHQSMGDLDLEKHMPSWGIYSKFDKLTNTLIDVVSICPSARQIKIFRVGAGGEERDREFSY